MDSSSLDTPALPGNRLIAYIRSLAKAKKGLPYGLPVCVAPSHTVTSTDALLRLASLVGPYITLLQVHADIIDDWSEETIRQLTALAKKYAFLIWESGRILNSTIDVVGRQKKESREVRNALVDLIRKKYTKGVVKPASWATLSTAWASGVAVNNQAADILIPSLKAAAREAVADAVRTIRTEITADNIPDRPFSSHNSLANGPNSDPQSTSDHAIEESNSGSLEPPPRKASTISLTQTISQHTEDSNDALNEPEDIWDYGAAPPPAIDTDLPPPPLLARGLVLCLPSATDSSFTTEYRKSCMAAACANQDFVLGFLCGDSWHLVSQRDDELLDLDTVTQALTRGAQQQLSHPSDEDDETPPHSLALFSIISQKLHLIDDQQLDETTTSRIPGPPPDSLNPLAFRLYSIVREALIFRNAISGHREAVTPRPGTKTDHRRPNILHIPVVTLP
ncbi:hypothetical protein BDW59DRAFT_149501 [Aspergillus cavernicola]|uniref:Orotidine 5'-phosphate decarboxylase domain-containing protein n=1 Tax=Aspergillus cavernicola TaxID=176166 RepID=A0ABR4I3K4_9EURO